MVIFVLAITVLIAFVGLALDAGNVYINYTHLKRAVDSAAVAAANAYRGNSGDDAHRLQAIQGAAVETIALDGLTVDPGASNGLKTGEAQVQVYTCRYINGVKDSTLATDNKEFYDICPDIAAGQNPRKLVWVQATLKVPLYFIQILDKDRLSSATLIAHSISEASPLDLIIVLDTSGSMAHDTVKTKKDANASFNEGDYDPTAADGCITKKNCQPLEGAKSAALSLLQTLYEGYDKVDIVTYDLYARSVTGGFTDVTTAETRLAEVNLHFDPPYYRIWSNWTTPQLKSPDARVGTPVFNPTNPEDFDGDGKDLDNFETAPGLNYANGKDAGTTFNGCPSKTNVSDFASSTSPWSAYQLRWWDASGWGDKNPGTMNDNPPPPTSWADPGTVIHNIWASYGGAPCDDGGLFDSYNWNKTGLYSATSTTDFDDTLNDQAIRDWMTNSTNQAALKAFLCNPDIEGDACNTTTFTSANLLPVAGGGISDPDHWQGREAHDVAGRLLSQMTTCAGCAIRQAYADFSRGRDDSTWIMVYLSDGTANATDQPEQNDSFFYTYTSTTVHDATKVDWNIGQYFPNGFCVGRASTADGSNKGLWADPFCVEPNAPTINDQNVLPISNRSIRYCVNQDATTCPADYYGPGNGVHVVHLSQTDLASYSNQIKYGPVQYAMDMTDRLALIKRKSGLASGALGSSEAIKPFGDKSVSIFTIGFGKTDILKTWGTNSQAIGENLLRYMASVGDDGDRQTDPCYNSATNTPIAKWTSCGNYYYAPDSNELNRVFEDIAKRIQTKLSY